CAGSPPRQQRRAIGCLLMARRAEAEAEPSLADPGPGLDRRATADRAQAGEWRSPQLCQPRIGRGLDLSDALQQGLVEAGVLLRPRLDLGAQLGVVDREALAWMRQGIEVEARWPLRIELRLEGRHLLGGEEAPQGIAAAVGGAARSGEHTSELQSREKLVCR